MVECGGTHTRRTDDLDDEAVQFSLQAVFSQVHRVFVNVS